ncbi:MAG TPA: copper-binding protein [Candidatus Acidoferrum sp.]|nr:copper-binding protein [Candidatus Acidoferrum sp.]
MKAWSYLGALLLALGGVVAAPAGEITTYAAHGLVQGIADDRRAVTIHHDAIPGYMMGMTMEFPVKDTNDLAGIAAGDEINFTLAVSETESWVQNVRLLAHHVSGVASNTFVFHSDSTELHPGEHLPDGTLRSENGGTLRFSDFQGQAVAFTFFFTRCPLPDYCMRMNRNFAAARQILLSDTHAPTNWQFLSISFDPEFDQPEVLASYAQLYRGDDSRHWLFATAFRDTLRDLAPRLDLMVVHQGDAISHNLRTVVIDPRGRITSQFDGNAWTPEQLADALRQAAQTTHP